MIGIKYIKLLFNVFDDGKARIPWRDGGTSTLILAPESTTADLRHIFVSRLAMVSADSLKHRYIHSNNADME